MSFVSNYKGWNGFSRRPIVKTKNSIQIYPEIDLRIKQIIRFINNECGNAPNSECDLVTVGTCYKNFFGEALKKAVGMRPGAYLDSHPEFSYRQEEGTTLAFVKPREDLTNIPPLQNVQQPVNGDFCVGYLRILPDLTKACINGVKSDGGCEERFVDRDETHFYPNEFVYACITKNASGKSFVFDKSHNRAPVQVLYWRNFDQSSQGMSACEYLIENPFGVLSYRMKSVFGNSIWPGDIIIVDEENNKYLKGFKAYNSNDIRYLGVCEFDGDFEELAARNQKHEYKLDDGNSFSVLVPRPNSLDRTRQHAVLDDCRWKALGSVGDSFNAGLSQIFGPLSSTSSQTEATPETSQRLGDEQIAQGGDVGRDLEEEPHGIVENTSIEGVEPVDVSSLEPCADGGEPVVQDGDAVDVRRDVDEQSHDDVENTPTEGELPARVSPLEERANRSDKNDEGVQRDEEVKHSPDVQSHEDSDKEYRFLQNFHRGVQEAGFHYNLRDIIRFYTSVKCSPFTLLGGAPGTGKSSLVTLYAKALHGGEYKDGYLPIDVSSSWTDPDDLFGYWDMKGSYRVAASGIVPFMWDANKSSETAEEGTFLPRIICFEEMNLARVEHYFSNMIQVLSRPVSERVLKGIPSQNKEDETQCQNRAGLKVAENLRFIGTCNFDETTQAFSARFYDRCSYIELSPVENKEPFSGAIPNVENYKAEDALKKCLNAYKTWYRDEGTIADAVINKYTDIQKSLKAKGVRVYISPRVENQIRVYILNRPRLEDDNDTESQMLALDEAIAQMVLPSVCGTSYPYDGNERLKKLKKIFEDEKLELCVQFLEDRLCKFESSGMV